MKYTKPQITNSERASLAIMSSQMKELNQQSAKAWVLTLASLASFMIFLDAMVVATALSTIRRDLGASIEALEWTVNAYNLSFAVLLLTGAVLGDRFGRRRMFAVGLGLFIAASAACALAGSARSSGSCASSRRRTRPRCKAALTAGMLPSMTAAISSNE